MAAGGTSIGQWLLRVTLTQKVSASSRLLRGAAGLGGQVRTSVSQGHPTPPPVIEGTREITYPEIIANKQLVILDVRPSEKQEETGIIPGAKLFPFKQMESDLNLDEASFMTKYGFAKPKLDAPLVMQCTKGNQARRAYNLLHEKGFTNHRLYVGSFKDWVNNGGAVFRPVPVKQGVNEHREG